MAEQTKTNEYLKLLMRNQRRIYAYILGVVPNHEDAEDLFQETILLMWSKFDEFEPGTSFSAWGITIAKFQILNARKKQLRRSLQLSEAAQTLLQQEAESFAQQIDHRMQILRACVRKLNSTDYGLVQMRYERECAVTAIAEHFGQSVQNIYKRIARVHDMLLRCVRRTIASEELA